MIRRLQFTTLALVAVALLLSPAALASGGKPKHKHNGFSGCSSASAVCVYYDGGLVGPGGGHGGNGIVPLSAEAAARVARLGGKDVRVLQQVGTFEAFGVLRPEPGQGESVGQVGSPSTFLAALDLGPGPIALFVTLLASATAFGVGGALRRRRNGSV